MSTTKQHPSARSAFRRHLFAGVPIYTTRLVRERHFPFTERDQVTGPDAVAEILRAYFEDKDREEFVVCLLDTALALVGLSVVSVGGLAASIVEPRQVFKVAALSNAAALILAHNHPSGNVEPSPEDIRITRQLVQAGRLMGIPVHDHIIVTMDGFTSLAERGLID